MNALGPTDFDEIYCVKKVVLKGPKLTILHSPPYNFTIMQSRKFLY